MGGPVSCHMLEAHHNHNQHLIDRYGQIPNDIGEFSLWRPARGTYALILPALTMPVRASMAVEIIGRPVWVWRRVASLKPVKLWSK